MNFERQIAAAKRDRVLLQAGGALRDNDLPTAETLLRTRLKQRPTDVAAIIVTSKSMGFPLGRPPHKVGPAKGKGEQGCQASSTVSSTKPWPR